MQNRVQLAGRPKILLLDTLDLVLVLGFKHTVTRDVIPLLSDILPDALQQFPITDTRTLQQRDQVIRAERAVRAAVRLAARGERLGKQFLA